MNEKDVDNLENRLTRLEKKVERLERLLRKSEQPYPDEPPPEERVESNQEQSEEMEVTFRETAHYEEKAGWEPESSSLGENWLNWLGIGLLLLGVVFLFKYSIDQGWLIPPVRSAFGLVVGFGLLGAGFISREGTTLRQILLGGGIAALYITGFATFQLYHFLAPQVVWTFMVGVTLLSLILAMQQDEAILSVIGTVGGLGTPFMLYSGEGSLPMLILYTCLILSGSGAVYMIKAWKSLLWSTVVGGSLVLLVGWVVNIYNEMHPALTNRWALQVGALFGTFIFWILPVLREVLASRDPGSWLDPAGGKPVAEEQGPFAANAHVQVLAVLIPVALLFYSYNVWSMTDEIWGTIALAGALGVGYSYLPLRREGLNNLSLVHGYTALILMTISLFLLLEEEVLLISLTLEALILRIITSKSGDRNISLASHLLFGLIGIWFLDRLMTTPSVDIPLLNLDALTEIFILGIAGLMVPQYLENKKGNTAAAYSLAAHIGVLGWFMKELTILQDGQAYVSVAWGIYALAILFVGFWKHSKRIRSLGMATIFIVVGKLLLIDLSQINTLLRILLFIGFGILFLLVSYFLHKKWGSFANEDKTEPANSHELN